MQNRPFSPFAQQVLHIIALSAFIVIAYYPSFDVPFIFDDFPNIVANPSVHPENFSNILDAFKSPVSSSRPLAMITFAANYWVGYLDEFGYHLINLIIHIFNGILLYKIILLFPHKSTDPEKSLDSKLQLAFWTAALWALHPVQSQAVTYIVQRMTSMATLFYLLSIYIYLQWRNKKLLTKFALPLITIMFALGMASKEIVITLPFALLLLEFLYFSFRPSKKNIWCVLILFSATIGIAFVYLYGNFPDWLTQYPNRNFSPWERVMTQWRIIWHYCSLLILPLPDRLHLAYNPSVSKGLLQPWTTLVSLSAIIGTWIIAWRYRAKYPAAALGVFFFFLTLSIESSFLNLELAFIHRLYLPTVFLWFGILDSLPSQAIRKGMLILLSILALWSFWTISRNDEWANAKQFWTSDHDRGASPGRALNNQAAALLDGGQYDQAIVLLKNGLKNATKEERPMLLYNLGVNHLLLKQYDESLQSFNVLIKEFGPYRHTYLFIGQILLFQNKIDAARSLGDQLLNNNETRYMGQILKANIFSNEKRYEDAEKILLEAIDEEKSSKLDIQLKFKLELAAIYLKHNKLQEAYGMYLDIIEIFPQNYIAWKQIYSMQRAGGDHKGAEKVKKFLTSRGIKVD